MSSRAGDPRKTYAYQLLRAQVRREEQTCWLCRTPIDMHAKPRTPSSWTLDHVIPLALGGPPLDRRNARAAHYGCNSGKRDRLHRPTPAPAQLATSRAW